MNSQPKVRIARRDPQQRTGAATVTERIAAVSPRLKARSAGVAYLLTILMGVVALLVHGTLGVSADLIATASYFVVTALFYDLFKPVNGGLSALAGSFNLVGLAIGKLSPLPQRVDLEFVFFGLFCLLIGYLIFSSTFLPRLLGMLMAFAGLGYLTFLSPPLASALSPYNLVPGVLGEGSLTLWLLFVGVNAQRWREQADKQQS